jgi:cytoskeleton protein RodZ
MFGAYLRGAREERHLTLSEISGITKIKSSLLADLENDDLTRWPKPRIYRRGYVASYARTVGLNPAEVLARFDQEFPEQQPVAEPGEAPSPPSQPVAKQHTLWTLGLVAAIVSFGVAFGWKSLQYVGSTDVSAQAAPAAPLPALLPVAPVIHPSPAQTPLIQGPNVETAVVEGELRITSVPEGAIVTVNGIGRGPTPARVRYLPFGAYTIRVTSPGYRSAEMHVSLNPDHPNQTARLELTKTP